MNSGCSRNMKRKINKFLIQGILRGKCISWKVKKCHTHSIENIDKILAHDNEKYVLCKEVVC